MEDQDGNMKYTFVDPLKVEVKVEVNDDNPWYVEHASAFLQYCCPECEYRNGNLNSFEYHAFQNHENARVLFANNYKLETKFGEYLPSRLKTQKIEDDIQPKIEQKMTCELCLVVFGNEKILKSHMREQHMAEGLYFCSYCDIKCKMLWGFNGLKYHIDSKHPESSKKNFFCTEFTSVRIHTFQVL